LHRIGMALAANFGLRRLQQKILFRSVRGMAVDAASVIEQRPMHRRFIEGIDHHVVVATLADLEADVLESKRRRRRWLGVTLTARSLGNRLVNVVEQQARCVRTMRVVARSAAGFLHGIVLVNLPERRVARVVAIEAQ